jgi:hypothetical protein
VRRDRTLDDTEAGRPESDGTDCDAAHDSARRGRVGSGFLATMRAIRRSIRCAATRIAVE